MTRDTRIDWRLVPACVFLLVLPFNHTVALRLTFLLFAAGLALLAALRHPRQPLPCKWPLLFWAGLGTAALLWSVDAAYSVKELTNEVGYVLIAFLSFFYLSRDAGSLRYWTVSLVASCLLASLAAATQLGTSLAWPDDGLVGWRNEFSTYVVLAIPCLMLALVNSRPRSPWRLPIVLIAVFAAASAYFTLNRTMWPALLAEVTLFWWLGERKVHAAAGGRAVRVAIVVILCTGFVAAFIGASLSKGGGPTIGLEGLEATISRDLRWQIWSYGIERVGDRPLLGHGYGRGVLRHDFVAHFHNPSAWHAHNMLLNYALELGVLGALALIALTACLVRKFIRLYRAPSREAWILGAFGLSLLLGAAIKTAADDLLVRENGLLLWSLLGIALGYGGRSLGQARNGDG